jgi:hypothetical protein
VRGERRKEKEGEKGRREEGREREREGAGGRREQ